MSEQTETVVEEVVGAEGGSAAAEEANETNAAEAASEEVPAADVAAAETAVEPIITDSTGTEDVADTVAEASAVMAEGAEEAAAESDASTQASAEPAEASSGEEAGADTEAAVAAPVAESNPTAEAVVTDSTGAESVADTAAEASNVMAEGAETAAADESSSESDDDDAAGGKRVVRVLSVGQEVDGTVKRITEFGAFVDIGVGRDGLLHVSELSLQRVAKVSDVLKQGQQVTVWIKELDRERNRISLTMVSPDTKTIRDLQEGELVEGTVSRIMPYGAFIDIGVGRDALLHVREMSDGFVKRPEDVVTLGETIEARIVSLSRRRQRIDLSLKGLRPEPEAEVVEEVAAEEEEVMEDPFENLEVLSPMELAFKRAMEGSDADGAQQGKRRKNRRQQARAIQDEIIARTLANSSQK